MPTYHVENFGCRATQADGAALDRQFAQRGLNHAPPSEADLVILNTCTVTAAADQDARAAIRRVQRQNPNAKIVVTGCYAQRAPQELAALPGVSAVIGNSHKHQLADIALSMEFGWRGPSSAATHESAEHVAVFKADDREGHDFSRAIKLGYDTALAAEVEGQRAKQTFVPLANLAQSSGSREPDAGSREPEARGRLFVSDIFAHTELLAAPVFDGLITGDHRTRPNLKVQDGCDNRCSFCVIPYVRGQSRSLPLHEVLREVNALVTAGYRELVISGINLGRWGKDFGPRTSDLGRTSQRPTTNDQRPGFADLLRAILSDTSLEKLRISSVEPMDWSDELIRLAATSPRIAKHAHVPLQSGSDAVLRRMHRKYRPWHYREKIEKIRAAMPTAAIGADVMVGFPGETATEFEATRQFIEDLPFTYLHVFTYSARPGTPAADSLNQVPVRIARERNRILRDLAEEKKRRFMNSFIGETVEAITLWSCGAGAPARDSSTTLPLPSKGSRADSPEAFSFTEALTDNYLKLRLKGHYPSNRWIKAEVRSVESDVVVGQVT